eukprot:Seg4013.3 transcript_id=Seg4013.3/GoldUCD/mRNA.D3Y31 product="Craniofacial development protein 2" protein_id=Seg4013.3/GoldUCD/D3Y31
MECEDNESRELDVVKSKMERTDILEISELKWTGMGFFRSDEHIVYYSGNEKYKKNGVAVILNKRVAGAVLGYKPVNGRIISLRLQGHPVNYTIIQVYSPTTYAEVQEIEEFYDKLQQVIDTTAKGDTLFIIGDFNAKVGEKEELGIVGKYGLGNRNNAGERLIELCAANDLFITNTFFPQPKRRRYTWISPNGRYRNQIDYILCIKRWRSAMQVAKTLPGADCGTDHQLLISKIRIRLKKKANNAKAPTQFNVEEITT